MSSQVDLSANYKLYSSLYGKPGGRQVHTICNLTPIAKATVCTGFCIVRPSKQLHTWHSRVRKLVIPLGQK